MNDRGTQILRGGRLLDVAARTVEPADILVEGDTVREVGPPGLSAPPDAAVVDASDRLLMPGLVNAHTHGHGALGKGKGDRWSLELYLNAAPWAGGPYTLDDKRLGASLNAAEMVLKGCTAAYDMFLEFPRPTRDGLEAAAAGYRDVGVRVLLAPMMSDRTLYDAIPGLLDAIPEPLRAGLDGLRAAPQEASVAACRELLADWPHDPAVAGLALGPTIPHHCSDPFIAACRDLAAEHGARVQMHLAESKVQAVTGIRRYERSLARHLDDLGLVGPGFTGAHGVWLDDEDLALIADRGASIAHNPGSNLRLGSGIAPARRMLDRGIAVGIGTDGSASSDNQNMFEAMRFAAYASRVASPDPERWLGAWEVLALATEGSARALGLDGVIGRIAPGYKADVVFLDLASVNFVPLNDVANQVVHCEDGSAVHSVMIGGRMVLEGRRFTGFDFAAMRAGAAAAVDRLGATTAPARERQDALETFVGRHCVGLARDAVPVTRRLDYDAEPPPVT